MSGPDGPDFFEHEAKTNTADISADIKTNIILFFIWWHPLFMFSPEIALARLIHIRFHRSACTTPEYDDQYMLLHGTTVDKL